MEKKNAGSFTFDSMNMKEYGGIILGEHKEVFLSGTYMLNDNIVIDLK